MKLNYSAIIKSFCIPEFKLILGKRYVNFFVLFFALVISILGIGIGKGSIEYLRLEMDNPYVKFVEVIVPFQWTDDNELDKKLGSKDLKKEYNYTKTLDVYFDWADFKGSDGRPENALIRGVTKNGAFYRYISRENKVFITSIVKNYLFDRTDWGCVVTEQYLQSLGQKVGERSYLTLLKYNGNNTYNEIKVPICGVVPYLPDKVDVLVSQKFLAAVKNAYKSDNPFELYLTSDYGIRRYYTRNKLDDKVLKDLDLRAVPLETCFGGYLYEGSNRIEVQNKSLMEVPYFDQHNFGEWYDLLRDKVVIVTDERTDLKGLNKYLKKEHKLSIDLRALKSKEYFNMFSDVSNILSLTVIVLSIITIILFISNLLINHINANAKNIGTLKAFGLSNRMINAIYGGISLAFILFSVILAFAISSLIGKLVINNAIREHWSFLNFKLISVEVIFLFMVVLPVLIITTRLNLRLKDKTPGDLIYERK